MTLTLTDLVDVQPGNTPDTRYGFLLNDPEASLPATTTARLRVIADHLEAHPHEWDQSSWLNVELQKERVHLWAGKGHCGTTGCIAGHAVLLTPPDEFVGLSPDDWEEAGLVALGFDSSLLCLFDARYVPGDLPATLRQLAELPEPRTLAAAVAAKVDLAGCDLLNGDVRGLDVSYLHGTNLRGALCDERTVLPPDWTRTESESSYNYVLRPASETRGR